MSLHGFALAGFYMQLMEKAYFHYKDEETVPQPLKETAAVLQDADCFVVCTPEMNHTIAPGLTNMVCFPLRFSPQLIHRFGR